MTLNNKSRMSAKDGQAAGCETIPGLVKAGRPATTLICLRFPCEEAKPSKGLLGGMPPKKRPLTRADAILKKSEEITGKYRHGELDPISDTASEKTRNWLRNAPGSSKAECPRGKLISALDICISFGLLAYKLSHEHAERFCRLRHQLLACKLS